MQRCGVIYWTGNNGKILNGMWTDHVTGYKFWIISTSYNIEGGSSEVFWIVFCFSVNTEAVPPSSGIVLHETCIKAGLDSLVASFFACFFLSAIIRLISFLLSSAALKNVSKLRIRLETVKLNRSMECPYLSVIFFFNSLLFFLFCFRLDLLCCLWYILYFAFSEYKLTLIISRTCLGLAGDFPISLVGFASFRSSGQPDLVALFSQSIRSQKYLIDGNTIASQKA